MEYFKFSVDEEIHKKYLEIKKFFGINGIVELFRALPDKVIEAFGIPYGDMEEESEALEEESEALEEENEELEEAIEEAEDKGDPYYEE